MWEAVEGYLDLLDAAGAPDRQE
ncbi:hypothetical protein [Actinophytocola sp.]